MLQREQDDTVLLVTTWTIVVTVLSVFASSASYLSALRRSSNLSSSSSPSATRSTKSLFAHSTAEIGPQAFSRTQALCSMSDSALLQSASDMETINDTLQAHRRQTFDAHDDVSASLGQRPALTSVVQRRSLGSEMGLNDQAACHGTGMRSTDDCSTLETHVNFTTYESKTTSEGDSLADICASIERMKREIIIVEMEESLYDHDAYEEHSAASLIESSADLTTSMSAANNRCVDSEQYDVQTFHARDEPNYLEPVAEVTEEPTMFECSEDISLDLSTFQAQKNRGEHADPQNCTTTPAKHVDNMAWARLHGLATPSTVTSTLGVSHFGWAEVIASARKARPKALREFVVTSPIRSPARVLGLASAFWITSPPRFTLLCRGVPGATQATRAIEERTPSPRLVIRPSVHLSSSDDSGWADVVVDDEYNKVSAAEEEEEEKKRAFNNGGAKRRSKLALFSSAATRTSLTMSARIKKSRPSATFHHLRSLVGRTSRTAHSCSTPKSMRTPVGEGNRTTTVDHVEMSRTSLLPCCDDSFKKHASTSGRPSPSVTTHSVYRLPDTPVQKHDGLIDVSADSVSSKRSTRSRSTALSLSICSSPTVVGRRAAVQSTCAESIVRQEIRRFEHLFVVEEEKKSAQVPRHVEDAKVRRANRFAITEQPGTFRLATLADPSSARKEQTLHIGNTKSLAANLAQRDVQQRERPSTSSFAQLARETNDRPKRLFDNKSSASLTAAKGSLVRTTSSSPSLSITSSFPRPPETRRPAVRSNGRQATSNKDFGHGLGAAPAVDGRCLHGAERSYGEVFRNRSVA